MGRRTRPHPRDHAAAAPLPRTCRRDARMGGEPKRCFRTLDEAEAFINGGPGLNAYHCEHCNNYHVGHVRPDTGRRPSRRSGA